MRSEVRAIESIGGNLGRGESKHVAGSGARWAGTGARRQMIWHEVLPLLIVAATAFRGVALSCYICRVIDHMCQAGNLLSLVHMKIDTLRITV